MAALKPHQRLLVALDTDDVKRARALARDLKGLVGGVKLGKEFFTANGPQGVKKVAAAGLPVFLDLKFHDIPNTVAQAVRSATALAPFMVNVHAAGGEAMLRAAAKAARAAARLFKVKRPLVLGVTVLTSLSENDLAATGVAADTVLAQVLRLARLTKDCGLDGVVCSAREVAALRETMGPTFKLVVPGIRPAWASADDQKRIVTPAEAVTRGADYLVIGRPITGANDPVAAAQRIVAEIKAG
ncbi:MAG: orotidine-5'-phosphate decarboxylase [Rhodospirillales bacterium]